MKQSYGLEKIHNGLFKILKMFDGFCKENDIEYFLDSGTLLGAVREKDFIPWDDDVDLAMKRAEYEKLVKVKDKLPAPYKLVLPTELGGGEYFFDFTIRIVDTSFLLREETQEDRIYNNYQNMLDIDIFILDKVPANSFKFKNFVLKQKIIYGQAMAYRYNKSLHNHSFSDKIKIKILALFAKFNSLKSLYKKQEKLCTKYRDKNTKFLSPTNGIVSWLDKRFPAELYEKTVPLKIRDAEFLGPVGYDKLLTIMYGDYMTPPDEKERVPMHCNVSKNLANDDEIVEPKQSIL